MKPTRMTCKSWENPKSISGHNHKSHVWYSPAYRLFHFTAILTGLFFMGFLLNFFWEAVHGVYLYQGHDMTASRYVPMLVYVSGMDGLLILGLYGWMSLLWRDPLWMCNPGIVWGPVFIISAMILAAVIEYRAVFILNRWAYLPAMPTVSGIGFSPLFQLAVTGLISVGSVRCLCRGR